jgi:hypothetical protein
MYYTARFENTTVVTNAADQKRCGGICDHSQKDQNEFVLVVFELLRDF